VVQQVAQVVGDARVRMLALQPLQAGARDRVLAGVAAFADACQPASWRQACVALDRKGGG
jgi:hypothetical protein